MPKQQSAADMNVLLTQTISAWGWLTLLAAGAGKGDDTFWTQMLVLVIVAVFAGIFSIVRTRTKSPGEAGDKGNKSRKEWPSSVKENNLHQHQQKPARFAEAAARQAGKTFEDVTKKREKDLDSGMEILGSDFLLKVVENTNDGSDEKDVTMRRLNFKELARRGELNQADSKALKDYAVNKGNLYGKDIQCEAIKTLAERTAKGKK